MDSLKYKVCSGSYFVEITQLECDINNWEPEIDDAIIIREESKGTSFDTILQILVDGFIMIYYIYEAYRTGLQDLTILVIPESSTIFIGGKDKSAVINMDDNKVLNEFSHSIFYDFALLKNGYILETGETDCLLRNKNGTILNKVEVDPPWICFYEESGIKFEPTLESYFGPTFLKYP